MYTVLYIAGTVHGVLIKPDVVFLIRGSNVLHLVTVFYLFENWYVPPKMICNNNFELSWLFPN